MDYIRHFLNFERLALGLEIIEIYDDVKKLLKENFQINLSYCFQILTSIALSLSLLF